MKLISVSVSDIYLGFEGNKSRTWRKMQRLQKIVSGIPDDARDKHFSRRLLPGGRVSQCASWYKYSLLMITSSPVTHYLLISTDIY